MHCKKFSAVLWRTLGLVLITVTLAANAGAQAYFKVLLTFDGINGAMPRHGLTFDSSGNLYGAALGGSWYWGGVAFKMTPNPDGSWTETLLTSFDGGLDGWDNFSGLVFDDAGNLYGENGSGGPLPAGCGFYSSNGCGTVYKIAPNPDGSWTRTFVHTFEGRSDGRAPGYGLILDAAGNLYGTTESDGLCDGATNPDNECGTVFQLTPNPDGSWTHTVIYSFPAKADSYARGGITMDAAGNLYGTTQWGGGKGVCDGHGCGTVYKLSRNLDGTWTSSILHRFSNDGGGGRPMGGVILDGAGNLYGTTYSGGKTCDCGTVFRLAPNPGGTWRETVLLRFAGLGLGRNPAAGLVMDAAGNLYGTAQYGGVYGYGAAFKLGPSPDGGWSPTPLHWFTGGSDGANPLARLILDGAGNVYGTASAGGSAIGASGYGVVFEITP